MPTRPPESTHESELTQPLPPDAAEAQVESPSADRMQGAPGNPHPPSQAEAATARPRQSSPDSERATAGDPDSETGATADQDIDTAGTDADELSPTKAMGTGIAPNRSRG